MVRERPRFGSMAVGVLAGFGAGLLIAALLIAGRADRQMTRPVDAVVASVTGPSTAEPSTTKPLSVSPNTDGLASLAAQSPSSDVTKTVTETQVITKTELAPSTTPADNPPELARSPSISSTGSSVSVTPPPEP